MSSYLSPDSVESSEVIESDDFDEKYDDASHGACADAPAPAFKGSRSKFGKSLESIFTFNEDLEGSKSNKLKAVIAVVIVLVLAAIIIIPIAVSTSQRGMASVYGGDMSMYGTRPARVNLSCHLVTGTVRNEVYTFKGIPYAAPPVGKLRWQPPVTVASHEDCWPDQPLRADRFSPPCLQYNGSRDVVGSEDCLYVNVWTPQLKPLQPLQVMVFIHGGGLLTGSGGEDEKSPNPEITKVANAVFVSFNYRLNALGFLALDQLSWHSKNGKSGNYGFMDQIMALQWVQDNIAAFGGDTEKVTVFGEGAGATSILALLASPQAKDLFHRAWLMSPSTKLEATVTDAQQKNAKFVDLANCGGHNNRDTVECLYGLSPEEILEASPWEEWRNPHLRGLPSRGEVSYPLAIVDGDLVPSPSPMAAWSRGLVNDVPLLIGNMAQEVDDAPVPAGVEDWSWLDYDSYVKSALLPFSSTLPGAALSRYSTAVSPEFQLTSMVTDIRALCPTHALSAAAARAFKSPVYRYVSGHIPVNPAAAAAAAARNLTAAYVGRNYAFQGMDLAAYFGHVGVFAEPATEKDHQYVHQLRTFVAGFVEQGEMRFDWAPYPNATAVLTAVVEFARNYHHDNCDFWSRNGIVPAYSWIN